MFLTAVVLAGSLLASMPPAGNGVIEGVVVRAVGQTPLAGAEVVLRAKIDGQWLPVAETTADAQGRFRFAHLADDGTCVYLPGANHDGIHYPGPNVLLRFSGQSAKVRLAVYDTVAFPNPLVVRRHTIALRPQPGVLQVSETMLIDNPGSTSYVGQSAGKNAEPVTLRLNIPAGFERVTFAGEFFGRRFSLVGGKLVTNIPWPPGRRELTFSYVLPAAERQIVWERPLDLPSSNVRVSIRTDEPDQVACNLTRSPRQEAGQVAFEPAEQSLPAGHVLRVELGKLSVSRMTYAPWAALAILGGLIAVTCLSLITTKH